jgi:glucose/arabinose dehydrogenase
MLKRLCLSLALTVAALPAAAQTFTTSAGSVIVEQVVSGLNTPWAFGFLPDGAILITERDGSLIHIKSGEGAKRIKGLPDVYAQGQGGLLDVVPARDFAQSREIFLSFSEPASGGSKTALAVAKLGTDSLTDLRVIFRQKDAANQAKHYGSRIVEANDGTLYLTIGDRGDRPSAQDVQSHNGKVIRVNRDGSIPQDNPFANGGGLPEIWSFGHRNAQGAALDDRGRLWTVAHGPRGGDEVNQPQPGRNYGWPVISYGVHYSGGKVGEGTSKPGMEQPKHYWDPSIAPSGMMIYSGKLFKEWEGDTFVGSLKFDMISRLEGRSDLNERERLFPDAFNRIRDIREAEDGTIWFLAVGDDALFRIRPDS